MATASPNCRLLTASTAIPGMAASKSGLAPSITESPIASTFDDADDSVLVVVDVDAPGWLAASEFGVTVVDVAPRNALTALGSGTAPLLGPAIASTCGVATASPTPSTITSNVHEPTTRAPRRSSFCFVSP